MKKRLPFILLTLLLSCLLCITGWFLTHFYILFENSDDLFVLRHHYIPELTFHTSQWTYAPHESIPIYASWRAGDSVDLVLTDILQKDTFVSKKIWVVHQEVSPGVAIHGTNWTISHSLKLPANIPTGWFLIGLSHGKTSFHQSIFIRPQIPQKRIAWLLSTNTWNAYNYWGGHSIYSKNHTDSVSFLRPQLLADPFIKNTYPNHQLYYQAANKDLYLAQLLDRAGFTFDAYSMEELEKGLPSLQTYDCWIISTHTEYWTANMVRHLNTYLDQGGALVNLAGNVAAYVSYLDATSRSLRVHRAINNLWEETEEGDNRPFGLTPEFWGFHTYSPYEVQVDTSWMLVGTGLGKGDLVGEWSDVYDYSYSYGKRWTRLKGLFRKGKMGAASGLETDKVYSKTPANWVTVAAGLNPRIDGHGQVYPEETSAPWEQGQGGYIGYYEHPGGGIVCGVGSMAFVGALPYDAALRQMVLNMVERSLGLEN